MKAEGFSTHLCAEDTACDCLINCLDLFVGCFFHRSTFFPIPSIVPSSLCVIPALYTTS